MEISTDNLWERCTRGGMKMSTKEILDLVYIGLYDDGTIGVSDGVGYVGTISKEEVLLLYEKLKYLFERENSHDTSLSN